MPCWRYSKRHTIHEAASRRPYTLRLRAASHTLSPHTEQRHMLLRDT